MITSNSMSLAIGITTNTLVHCFYEEFGNFQFDEQSNYYIPSAGNLKTVARSFYTLKSEKGGTLCQAKPKNTLPLPSAQPTA